MNCGFTFENATGYKELDLDLTVKLQFIASEKQKWRKEKLNM